MRLVSGLLALAATAFTLPAMADAWECESRPAIGAPTYKGYGATEIDARAAAIQVCRDNHLICYIDSCADVPTIFVGSDGQPHGLGYKPKGNLNGALFWKPKVKPSAPESYDLRTLGWISPIKDQGQCGSCWAFSVTKALESARLRAGFAYQSLSEQAMVSCDDNAAGCSGGEMSDMDYVVKTGLPLDKDYPYTASDSRCKSAPVAVKGTRWGYVGSQGGQATLAEVKQALLDYGVLSVTVAAGGQDWNDGGHMDGCNTRGVNHMVTIAGWLPTDELIMGNSWGTSWGDEGFGYLKLGCDEFGSGDESISFVVVDGGPSPVPPHVTLPIEVDIKLGTSVVLGVPSEAGVSYAWTADGAAMPDTTSEIYVAPMSDTTYQITATTAGGTAQSSVLVKVSAAR